MLRMLHVLPSYSKPQLLQLHVQAPGLSCTSPSVVGTAHARKTEAGAYADAHADAHVHAWAQLSCIRCVAKFDVQAGHHRDPFAAPPEEHEDPDTPSSYEHLIICSAPDVPTVFMYSVEPAAGHRVVLTPNQSQVRQTVCTCALARVCVCLSVCLSLCVLALSAVIKDARRAERTQAERTQAERTQAERTNSLVRRASVAYCAERSTARSYAYRRAPFFQLIPDPLRVLAPTGRH